ncbi:hypothetical protein [Natrialba asiatica]|uniref:hypothetical protein n=1 Tax=Natrialba asiatica TaxID=64602 RepID=UPI0013759C9A|nr:hypothetical protein [Natrialba asiatica]
MNVLDSTSHGVLDREILERTLSKAAERSSGPVPALNFALGRTPPLYPRAVRALQLAETTNPGAVTLWVLPVVGVVSLLTAAGAVIGAAATGQRYRVSSYESPATTVMYAECEGYGTIESRFSQPVELTLYHAARRLRDATRFTDTDDDSTPV